MGAEEEVGLQWQWEVSMRDLWYGRHWLTLGTRRHRHGRGQIQVQSQSLVHHKRDMKSKTHLVSAVDHLSDGSQSASFKSLDGHQSCPPMLCLLYSFVQTCNKSYAHLPMSAMTPAPSKTQTTIKVKRLVSLVRRGSNRKSRASSSTRPV